MFCETISHQCHSFDINRVNVHPMCWVCRSEQVGTVSLHVHIMQHSEVIKHIVTYVLIILFTIAE